MSSLPILLPFSSFLLAPLLLTFLFCIHHFFRRLAVKLITAILLCDALTLHLSHSITVVFWATYPIVSNIDRYSATAKTKSSLPDITLRQLHVSWRRWWQSKQLFCDKRRWHKLIFPHELLAVLLFGLFLLAVAPTALRWSSVLGFWFIGTFYCSGHCEV
jgi:hypothetical protein